MSCYLSSARLGAVAAGTDACRPTPLVVRAHRACAASDDDGCSAGL